MSHGSAGWAFRWPPGPLTGEIRPSSHKERRARKSNSFAYAREALAPRTADRVLAAIARLAGWQSGRNRPSSPYVSRASACSSACPTIAVQRKVSTVQLED
jgi:hypothetical protein